MSIVQKPVDADWRSRSEPTGAGAPQPVEPEMNPGDQAPPGTPGSGENICPVCNGAGDVQGAPCRHCGGTGKVIDGIGGA